MRLNKYNVVIIGMMLAAIAFRIFNHQYQILLNFSPVAAIALFGAANFKNRIFGFAVPMLVMFASDCVIGFHNTMFFTYGSFALIAFLGMTVLRNHVSTKRVALSAVASSLIFFIISNFGVWMMGGYAKSFAGLELCYWNAIPFFGNTLGGDLFFSAVLFGAFEWIKQTNWLVKSKA